MRLSMLAVVFLMCGPVAAQEAGQIPSNEANPDFLTNDPSEVFEVMLQKGCSVATDGCSIYRQKVFASVPMRQQTLSGCDIPLERRQFVCQQR